MAINEGNQGDWQKLDPRVADVVREQEEQMLQNIMGVTAFDIGNLFTNATTSDVVATTIVNTLHTKTGGITGTVRNEVQRDISRELTSVVRQERITPRESAAERVQRRTREFVGAVRKAIPSDIVARVRSPLDLPAGPHSTTPITIGGVNASLDVDISHAFWLNRIQDRDELVASLTNVEMGTIGITHTGVPTNHLLSKDDAEHIADSNLSILGGGTQPFWEGLLRHNAKTLLSDEQVSSLNVNEAVGLVMANDQVRRSIAPPDADLERKEQNDLIAEKTVAAVIPQLTALEVPNVSSSLPSWGAIAPAITAVESDKSKLATATPPIDLPTINVTGFNPSATPSIRSQEIGNLMNQLNDRKRELKEIDDKFLRFSSVLAVAIQDIRSVQTKKSSGRTIADQMINATGNPIKTQFTLANTPAAVATNLKTVLALRSSASDYDADIEEKRKAVTAAEEGKDQLVGREAVLKVFDVHNRQVQRLDARRSEEAVQTRYARNEMNKEEHDARGEAVEELTGRDQRITERLGNPLHNLGHGSPQNIICKLAESNTIGASTGGTRRIKWLGMRGMDATPKWTGLSYPRLITAYAALKKLNEDTGSPIHLRNTGYFKAQMAIVSNLLATRYAEQVERDFAREPESDEQRKERKGQGERNRKQRLIRLLVNNPLPSEYSARADSAIAEAAGRCNRIRRATSATVGATWNFTKNRSKNLFLGEGSKLNPITYPARTVKGVGRGIYNFLNIEF